MVIRRKQFAGYGEYVPQGVEYISAQLEDAGDYAAENIFKPIDEGLEKVENLPVIREIQPKAIKRARGYAGPLSILLKKREKKKNNKKTLQKESKIKKSK